VATEAIALTSIPVAPEGQKPLAVRSRHVYGSFQKNFSRNFQKIAVPPAPTFAGRFAG
jgi:hypothetical protein